MIQRFLRWLGLQLPRRDRNGPARAIEHLPRALAAAGVETDDRDLADILWLARVLPKPLEQIPEAAPKRATPTSARKTEVKKLPTDSAPAPERRKVLVRPEVSGGVYIAQQAHGGEPTMRASALRVPSVAALPGAIEIGRALRPFMRRRRSATRFDFDPEASVDRFADTGVLAPVLRPGLERWFDVALVIDDGPSMAVWRLTNSELFRLLARLGAFRDVRRWMLAIADGKVHLVSESGLVRDWRELIDPSSRRLILLVTDCIGPHWDRPAVWEMLAGWGASTPTVLIQVLPERLWSVTPLGEASTPASSRFPGVPNSKLDTERAWWDFDGAAAAIALPVMTLVPESVNAWARLVMARGNASAPSVPARAPESGEKSIPDLTSLTPEDRVRRFKSMVSPEAYQLAVYFSAVPLTLPVMRLIQSAMSPKPRLAHLAEFFLGALIERVSKPDAAVSAEEVEYDFIAGVRGILQASLMRSQALRVLQAVSGYLEQNFGQPLDFRALIADAKGEYTLPAYAIPFATIGAAVLEKLGHIASDLAGSQTQATVNEVLEEEFARGLTIRKSLRSPGLVREAVWSPDGSMFTLRMDGQALTYSAQTLQIVERFSIQPVGAREIPVAWLESDTLVYVTPYGPALVGIGGRPFDWDGGVGRIRSISSAEGVVAMLYEDGRVGFWPPDAMHSEIIRSPLPASTPAIVAWSPNGSCLATVWGLGYIRLQFRNTSEGFLDPVQLVSETADQVATIRDPVAAWSPDGRLLAVCTRVGTVDVWSAEHREKATELHSEGCKSISFSRDGRMLAAQGSDLVVWRTGDWTELLRVPMKVVDSTMPVAFSPVADEVIVVQTDLVYVLRVDRQFLSQQTEPRGRVTLPVNVYLSYCNLDRRLVGLLRNRLNALEQEGLARFEDAVEQIESGTDRAKAIESAVAKADVFIAFVSPGYVSSDFNQHEYQISRKNPPLTIPILVEPANWKDTDMARYQALPSDGRTVSEWSKQEDAIEDIAVHLRNAFIDLIIPSEVRARARRAVVSISSPSLSGSGTLVSSSGHVLTKAGPVVVPITVLVDGVTLAARAVDVNPVEGLAVLKIEGLDFQPLPLRHAAEGIETVMAAATSPVTGFTEQLGRMQSLSGSPYLVVSFKLDMAGFSGGPVIDDQGRIVGVFDNSGNCIPGGIAKAYVERVLNPDPNARTNTGNTNDHHRLKELLMKYEGGSVPFMHFMPPDQVMVGVRHQLRSVDDALTLNFVVRHSASPATAGEIVEEYEKVRAGKQPLGSRSQPRVELPPGALEALLNSDIAKLEQAVRQIFAGYDSYPEPAQDAILDMAHDLGPAALASQYPKLKAAAEEQDWATCAAESNRNDARDLFLEAAESVDKPATYHESSSESEEERLAE